VARALRRYRVWNWAWYVETVKIPGITDGWRVCTAPSTSSNR
jgi:hypothetical protein